MARRGRGRTLSRSRLNADGPHGRNRRGRHAAGETCYKHVVLDADVLVDEHMVLCSSRDSRHSLERTSRMPAGEGQLRGHAFVASTRMLSCWAPMIFVMRSWMRPRPLRADFGSVAHHAAAALLVVAVARRNVNEVATLSTAACTGATCICRKCAGVQQS